MPIDRKMSQNVFKRFEKMGNGHTTKVKKDLERSD